MPSQIVNRIKAFNRDRIHDMVQLKYKAMHTNAFVFFRGTCHLFYEDWPKKTTLNDAPPAWLSGDLHLENFGTYKGDNRLTYFGLNDFDEGALAPCTWDIARLVTSILVAMPTLQLDKKEALKLCRLFIEIYAETLGLGLIRTVERSTAVGMVKELLIALKQRNRGEFLNLHTTLVEGQRAFKLDNTRLLPASKEEKKKIRALVKKWRKSDPFFKVLDICHRVAGTGSLGLERYVILVEGHGSPDHNFILDLKEERASALQPYLTVTQPKWTSEAERAVRIQERVQTYSPALLSAVHIDDKPYLLREFQPLSDRVALNMWGGRLGRLKKVITTMAQVVAWGQLRASGRQGSSTADDLIHFGQQIEWRREILTYAQTYAHQVESDYLEFKTAYEKGEFK